MECCPQGIAVYKNVKYMDFYRYLLMCILDSYMYSSLVDTKHFGNYIL